ncbi:MAG: hypothetical protein IKP88_12405 [Lachnospiraceae bacterium]|nr:hypothetical protein [Lachnospiraceae bacterium]
MKIYHFTLLFAVFAVSVIVITDVKLSWERKNEEVRIRMDAMIDEAVNAAAWEMRSSGTVFDSVVEERAIAAFYYSLYASLGIMDLPEKRKEIQKYIPEIMITLKEGYYDYTYIDGSDYEEPYKCYQRSELKQNDKETETSFAAYFIGYPLEYGVYSGYRISGSFVMEREDY